MAIQKEKIAVITSVHYPALEPRIYYKEILSLAEKYLVHYIFPDDGKQTLPNTHNVINHQIPLVKNRLKRVLMQWQIIKIINTLKKLKCIHIHDPELILSGLFLKAKSHKIIFDLHEDIINSISEKTYIPEHLRRFTSFLIKGLFHFVRNTFDYWILAEDSYQVHFNGKANHEVIHNYPKPSFSENIMLSSKNNGSMIYVGQITIDRGVLVMIEVVHQLRQKGHSYYLTLVGKIPDISTKIKMEALIAKYHLHNNIKFVNHVPNEKIYSHLSKHSIGLALLKPLKNYVHSIPTKVYEYMLTGIPVVVSDFPMYKKFVLKNECGFAVNPENINQIAEHILMLYSDLKMMNRFGENGKRAAAKYYNWSSEKIKLFKIYNNLN